MNTWHYLIIGLSCVLLAFMLWKEVTRGNKARLVLRIIATIVAVASFACFALPVNINKEAIVTEKSFILLTEGYNSDSVKAYVGSNDIPVYTLDEDLLRNNDFNAKQLPGTDVLPALTQGATLHIFGNGLSEPELKMLHDIPVVYHPSGKAGGVVSVSWKKIIKQGDKFVLQGRLNNNSSSSMKVILTGFSTTLDSVSISSKKIKDFELTTAPKLLGRAVHSLVVLSGSDTLESNPVPFEVIPATRLHIVLLSSSPDFENKFLKNWLSANGYAVTARTRISKSKFNTDFSNSTRLSMERITSSLLAKCNVLVADAGELSSISKQELAVIQTSVEKNGMGLIVKADSSISKSLFYAKDFSLTRAGTANKNTLALRITEADEKVQPLIAEHLFVIKSSGTTRALVTDERKQDFVSSTLKGNGRIILSTLSNTYSWLLAGSTNSYNTFWSTLLQHAAKQVQLNESWSVAPALSYVNKPACLQVQTTQEVIPQGQVGEETIYMEQDVNTPGKWLGKYWPKREGWHPAITTSGNTYWWYAYGSKAWKNVAVTEKLDATKSYAHDHPVSSKNANMTSKKIDVEFPKIYLFVAFLLAAAFLWAEKKYYA